MHPVLLFLPPILFCFFTTFSTHTCMLCRSFYVDDSVFLYENKEDLEKAATTILHHFKKFGLTMHAGDQKTKSKSEAMFFPTSIKDAIKQRKKKPPPAISAFLMRNASTSQNNLNILDHSSPWNATKMQRLPPVSIKPNQLWEFSAISSTAEMSTSKPSTTYM
jgi:hypothetical protein